MSEIEEIKEETEVNDESTSEIMINPINSEDSKKEDDLEERKKIIEEFAIENDEKQIPTEIPSQETVQEPTKEPEDVSPDIISNDDLNQELEDIDDDEISPALDNKIIPKNIKTVLIVVIVISIVAWLSFEDKIISSITPIEELVISQEIQPQNKLMEDVYVAPPMLSIDNNAVVATIPESKEPVKDLTNKIQKQESKIAVFGDRNATLQRQISNLEYKNSKLERENRKLKGKTQSSTSESTKPALIISKSWKIDSVLDNGQRVNIALVGSDRKIEVTIGDTLMDVGTITSIKKTSGKWFVIGSRKAISE